MHKDQDQVNFVDVYFSRYGTERIQVPLKAGAIVGPLAKRHLNGVSLAVMECWLSGSFVIFQWIRTPAPIPPLDPPMYMAFMQENGI